jgi:hypothetical protein
VRNQSGWLASSAPIFFLNHVTLNFGRFEVENYDFMLMMQPQEWNAVARLKLVELELEM